MRILAALAWLAALPAFSQPVVHADRSVTFRVRAPRAGEVLLDLEGAARRQMEKDAQGVWSVTTPPLAPDLYGYSFLIDGLAVQDPANPLFRTGRAFQSELAVHGEPPALWEPRPVPKGAVHQRFYRSAFTRGERDFWVYTPPAYDDNTDKRYPLLVLLGDAPDCWIHVGRMNVALDNLIASGRAKPMIVVMSAASGEELLGDVIRRAERLYRIAAGREAQAIAGPAAFSEPERFAWVEKFGADDTWLAWRGAFVKFASKIFQEEPSR